MNRRSPKRERPIELAPLFNKLPPHALEAEAALLGSMILDWRVCGDVRDIIQGPEDFYYGPNAAIYGVLQDLYEVEQSIDLVQLNQRLIDKQILDQVGGADYLVDLAESVPSAANAGYYAKIVRDKAMVRGVIKAAGRILHDCYHTHDEALDVIGRATEEMFDLRGRRDATGLCSAASVVDETMAEIDEGRDEGLAYGFFELDEMTAGLHEEEFVVIGARPSMGKTALACNIALNLCLRKDIPVVFFSLEMSRQQLMRRLLCSFGEIDLEAVRKHPKVPMGPEAQNLLGHAAESIRDSRLIIDGTAKISDANLQARARKAVQESGAKVIIIDYIQLMTSAGRYENRQQEITAISAMLKALARQTKTTVIGLSQLKRPGTGHVDRPRMSDLRESGSIEQDADLVALLHREEYYHKGDQTWIDNNPEYRGKAELIIDKQRNGPTGVVNLNWKSWIGTFTNWGVEERPVIQESMAWTGREDEVASQVMGV